LLPFGNTFGDFDFNGFGLIMAVLAFFKTSLVIDDRLAPSDISA
jgi:hypothetical protein